MTKQAEILTRRAALKRLGLGIAVAYSAPALTRLSQAHAKSGSSSSSGSSSTSGSSRNSSPSAPSPASKPSSPSGASGAEHDADDVNDNGGCRVTDLPGRPQISRRDLRRAQRAVANGQARPLREVYTEVSRTHPGRLIEVGFSEDGPVPVYRLQIVSRSGAIQTIVVQAATGQITSVGNC